MGTDDPGSSAPPAGLVDEALEQICDRLSDLYFSLYEERPVDARAALTGNMLAFVFDGGLAPGDEWLLRSGRGERVREFRQNFFDVISEEMVGVVGELTGVPVTYSFYGFDPTTRTTLSIFVLDTSGVGGAEQGGEGEITWSEQVSRNARLLPEGHRGTRAVREAIAAQMKVKRDEVRRETAADEAAERPGGSASE